MDRPGHSLAPYRSRREKLRTLAYESGVAAVSLVVAVPLCQWLFGSVGVISFVVMACTAAAPVVWRALMVPIEGQPSEQNALALLEGDDS